MEFEPPLDCAFSTPRFAPGDDVLAVLRAAIPVLGQAMAPLRGLDDWWEHDGLIFDSRFAVPDLRSLRAASLADLAAYCSDDDFVCVGLVPENQLWYLRYRVEIEGEEATGHCDIFAQHQLAAPLGEALRSTIAIPVNPRELLSSLRAP